jgi:integrase
MAGRGHVRRRGKGWVFVIRHPALEKAQEWSRQYPTEDEAQVALSARLVELDRGVGIGGSKDTVEQFMAAWLVSKKSIRASSRVLYADTIRLHINPYLGEMLLTKLGPRHIAAWHGRLLRDGRSQRTVNYAQRVLTAGLRQAVKWGYISRDPSALVERATVTPKEAKWWTQAEARAFLAATEDTRFGTLFRVAIAACLRYSEVSALRWDDVDLKAKRITIRRTWSRSGVPGMPWIEELPKDHEIRTVPIDDATVAALVRHRDQQAFARSSNSRWVDNGLVFPGRDGQMVCAETVRRALRRDIEQAGVPVLSFHGLRHTGATLLLLAGVPLVVVSRILGHSSVSFTASVYLHVDAGMLNDAGDGMGRMLSGGS